MTIANKEMRYILCVLAPQCSGGNESHQTLSGEFPYDGHGTIVGYGQR